MSANPDLDAFDPVQYIFLNPEVFPPAANPDDADPNTVEAALEHYVNVGAAAGLKHEYRSLLPPDGEFRPRLYLDYLGLPRVIADNFIPEPLARLLWDRDPMRLAVLHYVRGGSDQTDVRERQIWRIDEAFREQLYRLVNDVTRDASVEDLYAQYLRESSTNLKTIGRFQDFALAIREFEGGLILKGPLVVEGARATFSSNCSLTIGGTMRVEGETQFEAPVQLGEGACADCISSGQYLQSSDSRIKPDAKAAVGADALDLVRRLKPVTYNAPMSSRGLRWGLKGQEVANVAPWLTKTSSRATIIGYTGPPYPVATVLDPYDVSNIIPEGGIALDLPGHGLHAGDTLLLDRGNEQFVPVVALDVPNAATVIAAWPKSAIGKFPKANETFRAVERRLESFVSVDYVQIVPVLVSAIQHLSSALHRLQMPSRNAFEAVQQQQQQGEPERLRSASAEIHRVERSAHSLPSPVASFRGPRPQTPA
jgi:hypothetical protein